MMKYEKPVAETVIFASLDRIARTDVDMDVEIPGIGLGGGEGGISVQPGYGDRE